MFTFSANVFADLASDRAALMDLYNSTDGGNWKHQTNWGSSVNVCQWYRVVCNDTNTSVIGLYLYDNSLTGSIPSSIGSLTNLKLTITSKVPFQVKLEI